MKGEFDDDIGIPASVVTKYLAEHGVISEKLGCTHSSLCSQSGSLKVAGIPYWLHFNNLKMTTIKINHLRVLPEFTQKYPQYERKGLKIFVRDT